MPHCLYRHYNHKNELLYVGVSINVFTRLKHHKYYSQWFDQITKVTIDRYNSRSECLLAERDAILTEDPKHNIRRSKKGVKKELTEKVEQLEKNMAYLVELVGKLAKGVQGEQKEG